VTFDFLKTEIQHIPNVTHKNMTGSAYGMQQAGWPLVQKMWKC